MHIGGEEVQEVIFISRLHACYATSVAFLTLERIKRNTLHVILCGDENGHRLVGNQIFVAQFQSARRFNAGAASVAELRFDFVELGLDDVEHFLTAAQDSFVLSDFLLNFVVLFLNLAAL